MRSRPQATVNASKLAKQIKKELTRNTKKTVALALVSVVALWFWAPLASKWIWGDAKKKKSRAAAVAAAEATAAATATSTAAAAPAAKPTPEIAWDLLLDHIAKDELMATATLPPNARDPFAITRVEEKAVAVAPPPAPSGAGQATAQNVVDPTPQSLGLTLEATFVSRQGGRAVISGKTYRLGDRVKVSTTGSTTASTDNAAEPGNDDIIEFKVQSIESLRVVLTRNEKEFPLVIKRESLSDDEQLKFGAYP